MGYTGAFYPWHGLDTLVMAAKRIADGGSECPIRFLLVGDGWQRRAIAERIRSLGLDDRFSLPGAVPYSDVPQYLAACDIACAVYDASAHRGQAKHGLFMDPLKIFEYLAAGRAAIIVDEPNLRRLFELDRHARFVRAADPRQLAEAIVALAHDPGQRAYLGAAGRQLVLERYSWDHHATELDAIFTQLIDDAGPHRH